MEDGSYPNPRRRRILATVAAVGGTTSVAGCSSFAGDGSVGDSGATDVVVYSLASQSKTVSITIADSSADSPHTSRTLELSSGEIIDPVNESKLPTNANTYEITVTVEGGPSETFEWTDPTVELAPLWVHIDDSQNVKFLLQAG